MDFDNFNTKDVAQDGRPLHLHAPFEPDKKLYDTDDTGKDDKSRPCRVWVRGRESRDVNSYIQRQQKKLAKDPDAAGEEEGLGLAKAMVLRFENIDRNGRPLTTTDDDLRWFFDLSGSFVKQVMDFSQEPTNFLPETSSKSASPPDSSDG